MIELLESQTPDAVIKVVGVGGCGGNAVDHMINNGVQGVEFISMNTDAQALKRNLAKTTLQLGTTVTKGLGAGANPEVGRLAAEALDLTLSTGDARALTQARRRFMRAHGRVFWILGIMQRFWYKSDARRERFVTMCQDKDVQRLTWQAYMTKELVRSNPAAHIRIFFKDLAHLFGWVSP